MNAHELENRGRAAEAAGNLADAAAAYQAALAAGGPRARLSLRLGSVYLALEQHAQAVTHLQVIEASDPEHLEALYLLGLAHHDLRRYDAAAGAFELALALRPQLPQVLFNLGRVYFERGEITRAASTFARCFELTRGTPWRADRDARLGQDPTPAFAPVEMAVNELKLQHDCEQIEHLLAAGKLSVAWQRVLDDYRALLGEIRTKVAPDSVAPFNAVAHPLVARTYKRPFHLSETPPPDGPIVNPALDWAAIEERYLVAQPGLIHIDGLLTPEGLEGVRRYCLESTIWNNVKIGYLGAYFHDGFASELMLRLAGELRERLPRVIRGLPLQMMWAYKYDNSQPGIRLHADAAAVNVNFWITDDEANLEPDGGGLLVYRDDAPRDWGFARYNEDPDGIQRHLDAIGSVPVRVPYRSNRAVIFDSDLFHATDSPRFREGYTQRRINVTLLYGLRNA